MEKFIIMSFGIAFFFGIIEIIYLNYLIVKKLKESNTMCVKEEYGFQKIDPFVARGFNRNKCDRIVSSTFSAELCKKTYSLANAYEIDGLYADVA